MTEVKKVFQHKLSRNSKYVYEICVHNIWYVYILYKSDLFDRTLSQLYLPWVWGLLLKN